MGTGITTAGQQQHDLGDVGLTRVCPSHVEKRLTVARILFIGRKVLTRLAF
jgi:hypothetical protein